jgi:hypothetical protein
MPDTTEQWARVDRWEVEGQKARDQLELEPYLEKGREKLTMSPEGTDLVLPTDIPNRE